ncbi:MAG TPA: hypothetical protein VGG48_19290 [Rhizomicrobium sp.]|jgi:hypothetical protein
MKTTLLKFAPRLVGLGLALCLAGCVSAPPEVPFDHTTATNIHRIAVLVPAMPEHPTVRLASDIGQSFGLIGALIDAGIETNHNDKLWAMMQEKGYVPTDAFSKDLVTALTEHGYEATLVPAGRENDGTLKTYPPGAYDAYLDVTGIGIAYGYMAAGVGTSNPYRPFVYIRCRLIRAGDGAVLMQDAILYNPVNGLAAKALTVSPDPAYSFPGFDDLEADHGKTVQGVDAALHQSAEMIGSLLK